MIGAGATRFSFQFRIFSSRGCLCALTKKKIFGVVEKNKKNTVTVEVKKISISWEK